ncbi:MAG TPA: hypothetical protein VKP88_04245 [Candidatus Paceibacterota bacterium]|nr:hypothetical protein [Candidatus Paceibacterota bacterium]
MATEKIEFEFPDPDEEGLEIEIEPSSARSLDEDDAADKKSETREKPTKDEADDVDIEVVDDTPPQDRGRKKADPPEDVTEEELQNYSESVQKRIKHFTKGYHDERREKEQALRENEELNRLTQKLLSENKELKGSFGKTREALLSEAKRGATSDLESAKRAYREAYESGDADAVLEAQDKLTDAKLKMQRIENVKLEPLQEDEDAVKPSSDNSDVQERQQPVVDKRAEGWAQENSWFGSDPEMTAHALGLHQKLVSNGVNPQSDEYYEAIDARMRQVFPDEFDDVDPGGSKGEDSPSREKDSTVVAPATRSRAPKKIKLTQTQVRIAKRLGVPLDVYAKQVAEEMRKG